MHRLSVIQSKLCDVLFNIPADHMESVCISILYRSKCSVTNTSSTKFGVVPDHSFRVSSAFRGCVYSRHELATPHPCSSKVEIVRKNMSSGHSSCETGVFANLIQLDIVWKISKLFHHVRAPGLPWAVRSQVLFLGRRDARSDGTF